MLQQAFRKLAIATTLALPVISLNTSAALAADQRDFTLINDSNIEVTEVYISTIRTDEWGEDILGRDTLPKGESTEIIFKRGVEGVCSYDLRVTTSKNRNVDLYNVNLCNTSQVIFNGSSLVAQ